MSNKTQLQTNNTTLDGYITRINAAKEVAASLPEAGGSGSSGDIETCTVTINCYPEYGAPIDIFAAMTWDGASISMTTGGNTGSSQYIIENVVCGSILVLYGYGSGSSGSNHINSAYSNNIEVISGVRHAARIIATNNGNAVIGYTPAA